MKILEKLNIYGWSKEQENLLFATVLTGDPLLMIGAHGSAKTYVAYRIAEALEKKFLAYDASKALFEDVLGFPNIEALKAGRVEYTPSAVTVWDKQFILVDELNRALPDLQSKWLEIIRSRRVMGFNTDVKWVWAAMNPPDEAYSAAHELDAALTGRFAVFLYTPEAIDMAEEDRVKVLESINEDDAPSLDEWSDGTVTDGHEGSSDLANLIVSAGKYFRSLRESYSTLGTFLAKLSVLVTKETDNAVKLDGRRLGFIYRNILAVRAIELARRDLFGEEPVPAGESATHTIIASVPVGIGSEGINREEALHKLEVCIGLLDAYFGEDSHIDKAEQIYRLFTTTDVMEKAHILLKGDVSELAKSKAWNDMLDASIERSAGCAALSYVALRADSARPGTVPSELLKKLAGTINYSVVLARELPDLSGHDIEYVDDISRILNESTDPMYRLIAQHKTTAMLNGDTLIDEHAVQRLRDEIQEDVTKMETLLQ